MKNNGPIIIIEDDIDDQEIFRVAFRELDYPNKVIIFAEGKAVIDFLKRKDITPFMILSDINMPVTNGFALREQIKMDPDIFMKCVPYLFFSTSTTPKTVDEAYCLSVQGFFKKENTIRELKSTLKIVVEYWSKCFSPGLA